jgi:hypothetical protein
MNADKGTGWTSEVFYGQAPGVASLVLIYGGALRRPVHGFHQISGRWVEKVRGCAVLIAGSIWRGVRQIVLSVDNVTTISYTPGQYRLRDSSPQNAIVEENCARDAIFRALRTSQKLMTGNLHPYKSCIYNSPS